MPPPTDPRAIVESYLDAYNERDMVRIQSLVATELESLHGDRTRDELTKAIREYWESFPDCTIEVEQFVVEDGMVTVLINFSGTHEAEYRGHDATDREFEVVEMMMWKVSDGPLDGYWPVWDEMGFYEQLGLIDRPGG